MEVLIDEEPIIHRSRARNHPETDNKRVFYY